MKKTIIATLLALPLAVSTAYAQDASKLRISGFGTGALTWTNTNDAQFARPNQASGVDRNPGTGVDSNLGLQAEYIHNDWLSATVQGLVRKDAQDDFGADLTWAFVKAKVTDNLSLRVGRIAYPVFMISDYRNVGYANTMLRPPVEFYSQVPVDSLDGFDITWQGSFGNTNLSAQLAYGNAKVSAASAVGPVTVRNKRSSAVNITAEHGPLTLRLGHAEGKISVNDIAGLNTLVSTLRTVGAGYGIAALNQQADMLEIKEKKTSFTSIGAMLDWNNIVMQGEYALRKSDGYSDDTKSWYAMAGYRIGKFLPYAAHSKAWVDEAVQNIVPASCPAAYGPACTPTLQALSAGVGQIGLNVRQSTNTVGIRWDAFRSAAIKFQIDRVKPEGNAGLLLAPKPGFKGPITVGAVAVDFVF